MKHSELRKIQFDAIKNSFSEKHSMAFNDALAVHGDSLKSLRSIPDHSVSLILTDPPYHSTKKDNIVNDKSFNTDEEFLDWMNQYFFEWKRILKPNGTLFMFCSSAMSAKLEINLSKEFNVLSHIVWTKPNDPGFDGWKGKMKKEALRQWYPHSERILFAEPAVSGNLKRSWFGNFLRDVRSESGLSGHQLTEMIGAYGKVNHGGAVSNWETGRNIPSRSQYDKIREVISQTDCPRFLPDYEDVIRKFDVNSDIEFTDVWNFNSVRPYKGKHPAEKPLDMLEHCINATTFENDIVLDCFAGSGSTAIAALNLGRYSISLEIEDEWFESICERLRNYDRIPLQINKRNLMKEIRNSAVFDQTSLFE